MADPNATKKLCPNGHIIDPAWEVCPYCPSERKPRADLARTVRLEDVAQAAPPAPPAAPQPRKTELLDRRPDMAALGWLVAVTGAHQGQMHPVDRERLSVGAARDCDIQLEEAHVSEHHASIRFKDKEFEVTDLDSTNGTFVNGEAASHHPLRDGDRVRFGSSEWVFKCVAFETA